MPVREPTPTPTPDPWVSSIATASADSVELYTAPGAPAPTTLTAGQAVSQPASTPMTFLVALVDEEWLQVHLPTDATGATAWVRGADVTVATTDYQLEVRLTEHRLLLHKAGQVVLDVPIGLGTHALPTPGGTYYLTELLQPPEPTSAYGVYVYGLSGGLPVLPAFSAQTVTGIHGTNDPSLVGTDTTVGCIRLSNEDISRLVQEFGLPLGTPVQIVP